MAKKRNQDSVKHEFFRRLKRGEDVDLAASKAGVSDPKEIELHLAEFQKTPVVETFQLESIQKAISTLKELCDTASEDDKVRCDAAKALLKFATDAAKIRTVQEKDMSSTIQIVSSQTNLWDF